jgi:hypothetical protein
LAGSGRAQHTTRAYLSACTRLEPLPKISIKTNHSKAKHTTVSLLHHECSIVLYSTAQHCTNCTNCCTIASRLLRAEYTGSYLDVVDNDFVEQNLVSVLQRLQRVVSAQVTLVLVVVGQEAGDLVGHLELPVRQQAAEPETLSLVASEGGS